VNENKVDEKKNREYRRKKKKRNRMKPVGKKREENK
jgi:hypothetical protein